MIPNISSATSLLRSNFQGNWWSIYNFDEATGTPNATDPQENEFKKRLADLEDQLFDFLNFSLLSGEYCQSNFEAELDATKELLKTIFPDELAPSEKVQKILQEHFRENFIEPLKLAVNIYREFYAAVVHRIKLSSTFIAFAHHEEITSALESKKYNENSKNNLSFWSANVAIARHDHFMTFEDEPHKFLYRVSRELSKNLNLKPYAAVLKAKCNFLIAKVLIRKAKEGGAPVYILRDSVEEEFSIENYDDLGIFKKEYDYVLTHYQEKNAWENYVTQDFDRIKQRPFSALTVRELHRAIKYFKDVSPSLERLQAIRRELQERFSAAHSAGDPFKYYSCAIALNYTINNEFSLLCAMEKNETESTNSLYRSVIELQQQTGVRNFFPQTKYLEYLLDNLNDIYEKKKALEFIVPCRSIIDQCYDLFNNYESNVEWSAKNYNYVFQLPPEECLYSTESEHVPKLFIFSSFLLPLPKEKYQREFEDNRNEIGQWKSSIDAFENVQEELQQLKLLKSSLTTLQSEMSNKEVKTLEVLGIFTAIVTFLASSIPAFKFIENAVDALLFMFALACSLGVFVLILVAINRGGEAIKRNRGLIIAILALAAIIWGVLIRSDERFSKTTGEQAKSIIDSVDRLEISDTKQSDSSLRDSATDK